MLYRSIISAILLVLAVCLTHAQPTAGTSLVTGAISIAHEETSGAASTPVLTGFSEAKNSYSFSPSYGYFISDRLMLGVSSMYSYSRTKGFTVLSWSTGSGINEIETLGRAFSLGLFARYNFRLADRFYVGGRLGISYGMSGNYLVSSSGSESSVSFWESFDGTRTTSIYLSPEVDFFVTDRFGLKASAGGIEFSSQVEKRYQDKRYNSFDIEINPASWSYGVFFCF